jgi:MoaA/NifB/PqqE/SkfB family radical SAM enzyme
MEPLMDKRMTKFALMVSKSKAKPTDHFRLQTNGILLDKHNVDEMKEAGFTKITISIDTLDPEIHSILRGGSDLNRILNNIKNLKKKWAESNVQFITTVNKLNIDLLSDLCKYAHDNGVKFIELRKMFYHPTSTILKNHDKMKEMLLTDEEFQSKIEKIVNKYKNKLDFYVNGTDQMKMHKSKERT